MSLCDLDEIADACHNILPQGKMDTKTPGGTRLWLGRGVPPGPRDPNPCLEVKKVPMFRDFAQMDPCLGIWGSKMGPMFRDFLSKTDPFGRNVPV